MTKEQMKKKANQHIASTMGCTKHKKKGYRESAWTECKALEIIMRVNREE